MKIYKQNSNLLPSFFAVPSSTAADAMVFVLAGTLAIVYNIGAPWVILAGGAFGAILHEDALSLGQVEWCSLGESSNL